MKNKKEFSFKKLKTLNNILAIESIHPKRCLIMSKNATNTGFTPWFQDEDGYWIGIIRWYRNNNKSFKIDYRDGNKKVWNFCYKIPILPKSHYIRIKLEKMEKVWTSDKITIF